MSWGGIMYDLIIKNARLVTEEIIWVGITGGKIVKIADIILEQALEVLDLGGDYYFSAGWIDCHVHCYEKLDLYYDFPDEIGIFSGVTSVIDAGSTGADNIADFYEVSRLVRTNVFALLNISRTGIVAQNELANLDNINSDAVKKVVVKFPDFIVGFKARMSKTVIGDNGLKPLFLAKEIQKVNNNLPLMIHIGSSPPLLKEILDVLDSGDVVTHCFHGKANGILKQETKIIKSESLDAYRRGVAFDVGHGTDSFNFEVAGIALESGIKSTTISSDIYIRNRKNGPVYNLATTMEKLLVLGYDLSSIIDQVTISPATLFRLKNKGKIEVGYDADFTIFKIVDKEKMLIDSNGHVLKTKSQIKPVKSIVGGKVYECRNEPAF